jgi:hypothetical protein
MALESYTCENCGTESKAMGGATAAETGYCSPACHTESEGLA